MAWVDLPTVFFVTLAAVAAAAMFIVPRVYHLAAMRKKLSARIDESTLRALGIE
jgi:hypothetical protein